jgi:hypothetical protein
MYHLRQDTLISVKTPPNKRDLTQNAKRFRVIEKAGNKGVDLTRVKSAVNRGMLRNVHLKISEQ